MARQQIIWDPKWRQKVLPGKLVEAAAKVPDLNITQESQVALS